MHRAGGTPAYLLRSKFGQSLDDKALELAHVNWWKVSLLNPHDDVALTDNQKIIANGRSLNYKAY